MTSKAATYAIWAVLIGTALLLVAVFAMPRPSREAFLVEGGPVEMASALLYFVAAVLVVWLSANPVRLHLPEIITLTGLGLREFDADDHYFTNGLMKPNQYVGPEVSLPEKAISAIILAVLIWAAFTVVRRYLPHLLKWHRAGQRAATAGLVAIGYVIVSELFDSPSKKVEIFGLDWGREENARALWVEETIELGIPLLLIIAVVAGLLATTRPHSAT